VGPTSACQFVSHSQCSNLEGQETDQANRWSKSFVLIQNVGSYPTSIVLQGVKPVLLCCLNVSAEKVAGKVGLGVIPSEARDLLFRK
jgi:hypothetical protein